MNLILGDKWCRNCEASINQIVEPYLDKSEPMEIGDVHEDQNIARGDSATLSRGNSLFESFTSQPCSSGSYYQSNSQTVNSINTEEVLLEVLDKLTQKINNAYDLNISSFSSQITHNLIEDSNTLKDIILSLQNQFQQVKTVSEKIQVLTVLPLSWQFKQVQQYFNCSDYMFREFKKSKVQNGLLTMRKRKKFWKVTDEMREIIKNYYLDEKNCYICPGIKQYKKKVEVVPIQENWCKKMLLYTLRDLYSNFIEDHSEYDSLPKFSFFASLKPEECVFAGDPGTHEICVCSEHENVKLKISALKTDLKYRDLFTVAVCNVDNADCMLHRCHKCPGVADSQKNYLYDCKNKLEPDTCIITMDFAENYSFIIQRSIQSFYYNNTQATLHPFCIYYKDPQATDKEKLQQMSFCVISDTTDHVAYTVHAFQEKLMKIIKEEYPWIKMLSTFRTAHLQNIKIRTI
ncbi:uncharacterized protein LOC123274419 [Cotesia glomerata]|uniref:uncharacterized protein LOC123274419 n=1 Tax=Cotesia glomerata TaxID=32391 RepID=UPI001D011969|nr:uncharacterized protein LOC123274419 [Cotesia glomerata]